MKAIKTLMAVSVLAAAGAANAATVATFSGSVAASIILPMADYYDSTIITPTEVVNNTSGAATAVLDDSGTFTITGTVHVGTIIGVVTDIGLTETMTGTWNGTTFTATGGTQTYLSCVDSGAVAGCGNIIQNVALPATMTGSLTLAGGAVSAAQLDPNSGAVSSYTYTFGPGETPAVPVPAAAWLFGSGLLGLAGTARRRRTA